MKVLLKLRLFWILLRGLLQFRDKTIELITFCGCFHWIEINVNMQLRISSLGMPSTNLMHSADGVVGSQYSIFQLVDVLTFTFHLFTGKGARKGDGQQKVHRLLGIQHVVHIRLVEKPLSITTRSSCC